MWRRLRFGLNTKVENAAWNGQKWEGWMGHRVCLMCLFLWATFSLWFWKVRWTFINGWVGSASSWGSTFPRKLQPSRSMGFFWSALPLAALHPDEGHAIGGVVFQHFLVPQAPSPNKLCPTLDCTTLPYLTKFLGPPVPPRNNCVFGGTAVRSTFSPRDAALVPPPSEQKPCPKSRPSQRKPV